MTTISYYCIQYTYQIERSPPCNLKGETYPVDAFPCLSLCLNDFRNAPQDPDVGVLPDPKFMDK